LSYERVLKEKFNGLLHQYTRKKTYLSKVTNKQIAEAERALNQQPRKYPGFKQLLVIFSERRKEVYFLERCASGLIRM